MITEHPDRRIETSDNKVKVAFEFRSNESGATFECKLDVGDWKRCRSPEKFKVEQGRHTFRVRATHQAANTGPADSFAFRAVGT